MNVFRLLSTVPLIAVLMACGGTDSGADDTAAPGEVLEGTISDEMLPLDRLRSQAPLAEPVTRTAADGVTAEGEEETVGEADTDEEEAGTAETATPADGEG